VTPNLSLMQTFALHLSAVLANYRRLLGECFDPLVKISAAVSTYQLLATEIVVKTTKSNPNEQRDQAYGKNTTLVY
jgi:hypothetical protein